MAPWGGGCGVEQGGGFVAGAVEEDADAEGLEAGGGGDLAVVHAFDVGEPEEFPLAGLEVLEGGTDGEGGVEVGGEDTPVRRGGFRLFEGKGLEEEAAGFGRGEGGEGLGGVDAGEELFLDGGLGLSVHNTANGGEDDPGEEAEGEGDGDRVDEGVYGLGVHGVVCLVG